MTISRLGALGLRLLSVLAHAEERLAPIAAITSALTISLCVAAMAAPPSTLYVSPSGSDANPGTLALPFRTIDKARAAVRELNRAMASDITVYLRGGEYPLTQTLEFNALDSGRNGHNVVYAAYPGENPIITGARKLAGWTIHDPVKGIYKASAGGLKFLQLYINGRRAVRARAPNPGQFYRLKSWDVAGRRIEINSAEAAGARLPGAVMIVTKMWNQSHLRIAGVTSSQAGTFVTPKEPERRETFEQEWPEKLPDQPYYLVNAYEFIDAPGEWYLDTATSEVYYKLRPGEALETLTAVAPALETLVRARGTRRAPVENIHFRGLVFEHSTWLAPDLSGYVGVQAMTTQAGGVMPGAIELEYAHALRFERNIVRQLGGSGIVMVIGAHDNQVIGNRVEDIAGTAIAVDGADQPSDAAATSARNVISNNIVIRAGQDYAGSVGIFAGYTDGTVIEHNEVSDLPYSGISVGWGWTSKRTALRNNLIRYNHIHHVMNLLADGGGVYTLSKQPGTIIAENYIHDVRRGPWAGAYSIAAVYLDNGSSLITVRDNVLKDVDERIYQQFEMPDSPGAKNNTLVNNDGSLSAVIAEAGLEKAYRDMKPSAE